MKALAGGAATIALVSLALAWHSPDDVATPFVVLIGGFILLAVCGYNSLGAKRYWHLRDWVAVVPAAATTVAVPFAVITVFESG